MMGVVDGGVNELFDLVVRKTPGLKEQIEANKDKIAEKGKAYREANKDKIAEKGKAYREANKDKFRARDKAYRELPRSEKRRLIEDKYSRSKK